MVDVGAYTCKFGYAGDDVPKAVFPGVRDRRRRVHPRSNACQATAQASVRVSPLAQSVGVVSEEQRGGAAPSSRKVAYVAGSSARLFRPHMDMKAAVDFGIGPYAGAGSQRDPTPPAT